jgi:hypothetical protein
VLLFVTLTIILAVSGQCPTIRNCVRCTSDQPPRCLECQPPLFAINEATGRCTACQELDGCWVCNTTKICTKCRDVENGPDNNNLGTCSACAPNCRSCSKPGYGSGVCDTCKAGFCLDENRKCAKCPENCEICVPGPLTTVTCKLCTRGFGKESGTGKCLPCAENCNRCSQSGAGKCDTCNSGYTINVNKQCSIQPCGKYCDVCVNDKCTQCKDRSAPVNGRCECSPNCESCLNANFGECDKCNPGFSLTAANTCIKKPKIDNGDFQPAA